MKIIVDQDGAKGIEMLADLALKNSGIQALQLVTQIIQASKLEENDDTTASTAPVQVDTNNN